MFTGMAARMAAGKWKKKAVSRTAKLLFDKRNYENGMTAKDFQAELMQLQNLSKRKVEDTLKEFVEARKEYLKEKARTERNRLGKPIGTFEEKNPQDDF